MITLQTQPEDYTPAYNKQMITATSNQTGNSDFVYIVECEDDLTGGTDTYRIPKRPVTSEMIFNAEIFSNKFVKHYVPNNNYGWQVCTDAIRKINIELKEYYGGNIVSASPPNSFSYIVWNGVLRTLDWVDYNESDFVYTNSSPFTYLFSGNAETNYQMPRGYTYEDKSLYLYALCNLTNTFETLRVKTYNSAGTLLGTSDIDNPYYNSADYEEKYFCIDVGHKGLSQISSGLVTGTYPIITSSVAYYELFDVNTSAGSPPSGTEEPIRRVDIKCEPRHTVYTVHYKAKSGNFETIHFPKVSLLTEEAERQIYKINPNTVSSYVYYYDKFTPHERVGNITGQERLLLNSDWMTENEAEIHRELFTSPLIYIDYGSTIGLVPHKLIDTTATINKNWNAKLFGITIQLEPTYKNVYGNG